MIWDFDSPRVVCRLAEVRHLSLFRELFMGEATMEHIGPVLSSDAVDDLFMKILDCNAESPMRGRYWVLSHARTGAEVGILSLLRVKGNSMSADIGLMLLPIWRNSGIGLFALHRCVDNALSGYWGESFHSIVCYHATENSAAGRLVAALGFSRGVSERPGFSFWEIGLSQWRKYQVVSGGKKGLLEKK